MLPDFGFPQDDAHSTHDNHTALTLPEELLLLSMRDDNGQIIDLMAANAVGYGLAGAVLMELLLRGDIRIHSDKTCEPVSEGVPEDALLNASLQLMTKRKRKNKKPYHVQEWVLTFYAYASPVKTALKSLVEKGIVRIEEKKTLGIFTTKRYPLANAALKRSVENRLWSVLRGRDASETVQQSAVYSMHSTNLPKTLLLLVLLKSSKIAFAALCNDHTGEHPSQEDFSALLTEALQRLKTQGFLQDLHDELGEQVEQEERQERIADMLEMVSDAAWLMSDVIDSISDAVDGFSDGGGADGGGDGGGGGGGGD
jgi:hypothetical protein